MKSRIWTGDGAGIDGRICDSREEAIEDLRKWRGWDEIHTAEHGDGSAVSCYSNEDDANEDKDGAYADTVSDIKID